MILFRSLFLVSLLCTPFLSSQETAPASPDTLHQQAINEKLLVENQSISLQGQRIVYDVHGGSIRVPHSDSKETAAIHFIAYFAKPTEDKGNRPIAFCFNGGPGSSSIWLHMGFAGPKIISTKDQKCSYKDNPFSLLSSCDLVFIDPVSTGFSKASDEKTERKFLGVEEDLYTLANFIQLFLTKYKRWDCPKLLVGESYGSARAVGLTHLLKNEYFVDIDGLILISLVLDLETVVNYPTSDLPFVVNLPTYAAISQYHKKLKQPYSELPVKDLCKEVSSFAVKEYYPALFSGSNLPEKTNETIAARLSDFTSIAPASFRKDNLRIGPEEFIKKIFENTPAIVGRFDGRMVSWIPPQGPSICQANFSSMRIDPSFTFVASAFTCAFNEYITKELKWTNEDPYLVLNFEANQYWNWATNTSKPGFGYTSFVQDLRSSLAKNQHLKVFVAAGYYDLATPYFGQEYSLNHLFLPENLQKNIQFKVYEAGHMIYLDDQSQKELYSDVSSFIQDMLK